MIPRYSISHVLMLGPIYTISLVFCGVVDPCSRSFVCGLLLVVDGARYIMQWKPGKHEPDRRCPLRVGKHRHIASVAVIGECEGNQQGRDVLPKTRPTVTVA